MKPPPFQSRTSVSRRLAVAVLALGCLFAWPGAAEAQEPAPRTVVDGFYSVLVQTMKQGKQLGYQGRYAKLDPAIEKAFNLPIMGRVAIGPQWSQLTPDQQQRAIDAFHKFSVANYAAQFTSYDGEKFEVVKESPATNDNVIIETRLVPATGESFRLNYLMRKYEGGWRIIDVYLDGSISEVSRRRAEFTSILGRDGIEGLIRMIRQKTEALGKD
jgi:phospholipid transport system substrate-binding protein